MKHLALLKCLDAKLKNGELKKRKELYKVFIKVIGIEAFLENCQDTYGLMEIAKYYNENPMLLQEDVDKLLSLVERNKNHKFAFSSSLAYASVIKS